MADGNRFNYRCPKCRSTDDVVIDAYVAVWLDGDRARVIDDISPDSWYSTNPATCLACRYSGLVQDFEIRSAQVIPLRTSRR
jgi:predicted nucleic-acid-binding Zn-ribbon protein